MPETWGSNGLARKSVSKQPKAKASFSHVLYTGHQQKCGPDSRWIFPPQKVQIKSGSSHLKWLRKNPSQVHPAAAQVLVNSRYGQVDKNSHHPPLQGFISGIFFVSLTHSLQVVFNTHIRITVSLSVYIHMLRIKPKALCTPGRHSTTELDPPV